MKTASHASIFSSLFLVLVIDAMGFGLILPILAPLFLKGASDLLPMGVTAAGRDFYYGLTMAIFFLASFFGSPFMGDLSDQLGRKKTLLLCLAGISLGYLISAIGIGFKSLWVLIGGRFLSGFAAGSQPIAQATIIDISTPENKTFNIGLMTLASCVGFTIGPLIAGFFTNTKIPGLWGFTTPFIIAAVLALINLICIQLFVAETRPIINRQKLRLGQALQALGLALKIKKLQVLMVIFVLFQLAWGIYFQFSSLYLAQHNHYSPQEIGLFMAFIGLCFSLVFTVLARILLRFFGLRQLILACMGLFIFALLMITLFHGELVFWLSVIPLSIGTALNYSTLNTLFSNRVSANQQGMIMGVTGSLGALAWLIAGLSMGFWTQFGMDMPFIAGIGLTIIVIFLVLYDAKKFKY